MSYKLNKTDGTLLVELVDGKLDITTSDIALIGKNYQGFGESINENFIKILESFSSTSAPSKPLTGQLWYDTSTSRLKVYTGTTFKSTDSTVFSSSQPSDLTTGDIWIDGSKDQLYFWNGTETVLVGPRFTKNQLRTGDVVETIIDTTGQNKTVIKRFINGSLIAIEAKEAFTPFPAITGFTDLKIGFNISSVFSTYRFYGVASTARQLEDELGNVFDTNSFITATDSAGDTMAGKLHINNDQGLTVGDDSDFRLFVSGTNVNLQSEITNAPLNIKVKNSTGTVNAITVDTTNSRVGIFKDTPEYNLDITGNMRITGDILVQGDATSLDVATLRVEDHQIELAIQSDSTLPTDAAVDDGGMVIRVEGDDKRWTWRQATDCWTASHSINLPNNLHSFKIDGVDVITKSSLGAGITSAPGLTQISTLEDLTIDTITLDDTTISSTGVLAVTTGGLVTFNNLIGGLPKAVSQRVDDLGGTRSPVGTVANIDFVEEEIAGATAVMGVDITGLGTGVTLQANVATLLEELIPVATRTNGAYIRLHTVAYVATTGTIDLSIRDSTAADTGQTLVQTKTAVDSAGVQNVSVVSDVSVANDPTGIAVALAITRTIMVYRKAGGGVWTYQSTTASAL